MTVQSLVDFLMQRISEDEVAATAAGKLQFWRYDNEPLGWSLENDGGERILTVDPGTIAVGNYWNHAARHLPARVLAECAAKRGIVELHYQDVVPGRFDLAEDHACDRGWGDVAYTEDCTTLRALAAVYSDHPDYRQDWAR